MIQVLRHQENDEKTPEISQHICKNKSRPFLLFEIEDYKYIGLNSMPELN